MVAIMDKPLEDNGYRNDFSDGRLHHDIYVRCKKGCSREMEDGNQTSNMYKIDVSKYKDSMSPLIEKDINELMNVLG